jgi:hypothetical protein
MMRTQTPRRSVLFASLGGLMPVSALVLSPDAELIRRCYAFAEVSLASWYRYVTAHAEVAAEQDIDPGQEILAWIIATPATTPAGMQAKALAYSVWSRDAYDNEPVTPGSPSLLLASLLRDMVAPARSAILAQLAAQYGPLPNTYTPEGIWCGSPAVPFIVTHSAHPDADLIAACAAYDDAERQFLALYENPEIADDDAKLIPAMHSIENTQVPILDRICELKAVTPEGIRARVRTVFLEDLEIKPEEILETSPFVNERLMAALLRDLAVDAGVSR